MMSNLARLADRKSIRFLNVNAQLADQDGTLFPGMAGDKLHLTLHFLGDVPSERLPELLERFAVPFEAFRLDLGMPVLWPHGIAVLEPLAGVISKSTWIVDHTTTAVTPTAARSARWAGRGRVSAPPTARACADAGITAGSMRSPE